MIADELSERAIRRNGPTTVTESNKKGRRLDRDYPHHQHRIAINANLAAARVDFRLLLNLLKLLLRAFLAMSFSSVRPLQE